MGVRNQDSTESTAYKARFGRENTANKANTDRLNPDSKESKARNPRLDRESTASTENTARSNQGNKEYKAYTRLNTISSEEE